MRSRRVLAMAFPILLALGAGLAAQEIVLDGQGAGNEATVRNDDGYAHATDANLALNQGLGSFLLATYDGVAQEETAGLYGDDDTVVMWSAGDAPIVPSEPPDAMLYVLDEDSWSDNNGDPYDNGALIAYLDGVGLWQQSDRSRKTGLAAIERAIDRVSLLNGYSYELLRTDEEQAKGSPSPRRVGLVAQEVAAVLPEAVAVNAYGEMWLNYAAVIPLLVEAIKEQQAEIEALRAELTAQRRRSPWSR